MSHLAYFRVSGPEQSIASQRHAMLANAAAEQFSEEFADEVSAGQCRQHNARLSLACLRTRAKAT